jgi:hypothetical protein
VRRRDLANLCSNRQPKHGPDPWQRLQRHHDRIVGGLTSDLSLYDRDLRPDIGQQLPEPNQALACATKQVFEFPAPVWE